MTPKYIAFDDKTNEPWFQASRLCKLFKYTNPQKAIRDNVNKQNRKSLENIVKKYKDLYLLLNKLSWAAIHGYQRETESNLLM